MERASEFGEREPWEGEGRESFGETKRPKREELWEKETPLMLFYFGLETDFDVSFGKCWLDMQRKDKREGVSNVFQAPAFGRKLYK